jgi:DNA-binding response OmpR family regulator
MDNRDRPLNGLRLLLIEDDPVIAMELDELIRSLGAEVVGPFSRLAPALAAVSREIIAGAVLDVRLDGETTIPIIEVLLDRSKPMLLVTGGGPDALPERYLGTARLDKPFEPAEFEHLATSIFSPSTDFPKNDNGTD